MDKWFEFWKSERMKWYQSLFNDHSRLTFYKHEKLAHYVKKAFDIKFDDKEMERIHWRQDWDLSHTANIQGKT